MSGLTVHKRVLELVDTVHDDYAGDGKGPEWLDCRILRTEQKVSRRYVFKSGGGKFGLGR